MQKGLEKRKLGNTGEEVTFIGYGSIEIGRDWGLGSKKGRKRPAEEDAIKVLNGVLDMGINIIDTARAYHKSEERIGKAVSGRRNDFFLSSKCGEHSSEPDTYYDFSYDAIKGSIDLSLEKLKVTTIDLMQIHFGPDPEQVLDSGETVQAMQEAKNEGKIKYLGASPSNVHTARRCIEMGIFNVLQLNYNLLNREMEDVIKLCSVKNIGVLIKGGLSRGALTSRALPYLDNEGMEKVKGLFKLVGNDPAKVTALALKFLNNNQGISSVLLGSKNLHHVKENFDLLEMDLSEELMNNALELTAT